MVHVDKGINDYLRIISFLPYKPLQHGHGHRGPVCDILVLYWSKKVYSSGDIHAKPIKQNS